MIDSVILIIVIIFALTSGYVYYVKYKTIKDILSRFEGNKENVVKEKINKLNKNDKKFFISFMVSRGYIKKKASDDEIASVLRKEKILQMYNLDGVKKADDGPDTSPDTSPDTPDTGQGTGQGTGPSPSPSPSPGPSPGPGPGPSPSPSPSTAEDGEYFYEAVSDCKLFENGTMYADFDISRQEQGAKVLKGTYLIPCGTSTDSSSGYKLLECDPRFFVQPTAGTSFTSINAKCQKLTKNDYKPLDYGSAQSPWLHEGSVPENNTIEPPVDFSKCMAVINGVKDIEIDINNSVVTDLPVGGTGMFVKDIKLYSGCETDKNIYFYEKNPSTNKYTHVYSANIEDNIGKEIITNNYTSYQVATAPTAADYTACGALSADECNTTKCIKEEIEGKQVCKTPVCTGKSYDECAKSPYCSPKSFIQIGSNYPVYRCTYNFKDSRLPANKAEWEGCDTDNDCANDNARCVATRPGGGKRCLTRGQCRWAMCNEGTRQALNDFCGDPPYEECPKESPPTGSKNKWQGCDTDNDCADSDAACVATRTGGAKRCLDRGQCRWAMCRDGTQQALSMFCGDPPYEECRS